MWRKAGALHRVQLGPGGQDRNAHLLTRRPDAAALSMLPPSSKSGAPAAMRTDLAAEGATPADTCALACPAPDCAPTTSVKPVRSLRGVKNSASLPAFLATTPLMWLLSES